MIPFTSGLVTGVSHAAFNRASRAPLNARLSPPLLAAISLSCSPWAFGAASDGWDIHAQAGVLGAGLGLTATGSRLWSRVACGGVAAHAGQRIFQQENHPNASTPDRRDHTAFGPIPVLVSVLWGRKNNWMSRAKDHQDAVKRIAVTAEFLQGDRRKAGAVAPVDPLGPS